MGSVSVIYLTEDLTALIQLILPIDEGLTEATDRLPPLRYLSTASSVSVIYLTGALAALIHLILLPIDEGLTEATDRLPPLRYLQLRVLCQSST